MTPFAIAGIQMYLSAIESNIARMHQRLDALMLRYPWVQMVVFSELAAFGPSPSNAQPMPGPAEEAFCGMASQHGIWLLPGSSDLTSNYAHRALLCHNLILGGWGLAPLDPSHPTSPL